MKKTISTVLLALSLFSMTSCEKSITPKSESFYGCFDTLTTVYDYSGMSKDDFSALVNKVKETLGYYNGLFDIYNPSESGNTNLYEINRTAINGSVEVNEDMLEFLSYSKEMYYLTNGEINIAAGSLLSLWHDYRENANTTSDEKENSLPTDEEIESAKAHINIDNLVIDTENSTVELLDSEMSLDVGAIAKGYAVERCAEKLQAEGYTSIVLDVGGNLRIIGEKAGGGEWKTGIRNPDTASSQNYIYYINIKNTSCVTSGGYERYYIVDGVRYHHLIDTDTGYPANNFASVTVLTLDSALADTLSSAFFIMDFDEGKALLETLDGVRVIWVYENGTVIDSLDFKD